MHFAFEFVSIGSTIWPIPPAIIVFDIGVPVSVRALDSRLLYKLGGWAQVGVGLRTSESQDSGSGAD